MLKTQGLTPVTAEQGQAVARKMNAQYMECSSKEMRGVDEIFERAIDTVIASDRRTLEAQGASSGGGGGSGSGGGSYSFNGGGSGAGGNHLPGIGGVPKRKKRKCNFL
jgi:uncharacterized membrane protein YgcG